MVCAWDLPGAQVSALAVLVVTGTKVGVKQPARLCFFFPHA